VKRALAGLGLLLAGCARHYKVEGLVIRADASHRTLLVSHRPIRGLMPAMTMEFHAAPAEDLSKLTPGTRVNFELVVGRHQSIARKVQARSSKLEGINGELIRVPEPANRVALGSEVPDFTLIDQSGRTTRLSDFRGRVLAIDFIYTRCPLPDVCPRLSANFAYLAKQMRGRDLTLLSITIDPQHDTPQVLLEYARRWQGDGEAWRFLTGTTEQVRYTAGLFGLTYWNEEGSITHTSTTAILNRHGILEALIEGSSYRPDQLRDLVEHSLSLQ
jgi:protein SCO1/2